MSDVIFPNKKDIVRKSDFLIKARYKLNPLALKFITLVIANVRKSDDENKEYVFRVKDFMELTEKNYKELYNELDEASEELLKSPLKIPKDDGGFLKLNWISSAEYHKKLGFITFKIDSKLRPYIFDLQERFLKYRIENILKLRSGYVIRLYEILKDWYNQQSRYSGNKKIEKIIDLKWLRETLEIPQSYQYSSGIKRRILEKAKEELAKNTDIVFDYEEIKTGRKVTHLKFLVRPNPAIKERLDEERSGLFQSRRNFVELLRKNYRGNGKFWGFKLVDGMNYWLGLDNRGLVYGSPMEEGDIKHFNAEESAKIYDIWLTIAQNSPLYQELAQEGVCLQYLAKSDKERWLELREDIVRLKEEGVI